MRSTNIFSYRVSKALNRFFLLLSIFAQSLSSNSISCRTFRSGGLASSSKVTSPFSEINILQTNLAVLWFLSNHPSRSAKQTYFQELFLHLCFRYLVGSIIHNIMSHYYTRVNTTNCCHVL